MGPPNCLFNVGGDVPYSVNELAQTVCEVMDANTRIIHLPARNEVKHAYSSHEKIHQYFELPEPVKLKAGLTRMAQWVRLVGARTTSDFAAIEIPFGLPAGW